MRKITIILLLIVNYAIANNIDSLINLVAKKETTHKQFEILINISKLYFEKDSVFLSVEYAKKAIINAKNRDNLYDYAEANSLMGKIYFNYGDYKSAIDYLIISKDIFGKLSKFRYYSEDLNTLAISYGNLEKYNLSIKYLNEMVYLNKTVSYSPKRLATAYGNIGFVYYILNRVEISEQYYLDAIKLFEEMKDSSILIDNYVNLGLLYGKQNKNKEAESYLYKALKILNLSNKKAFHKAGTIYEHLAKISKNNSEKKSDFLFKSLDFYKKSENNTDISNAYSNLADFYGVTNIKKSMEYLDISITICEKTNNNVLLYNRYLLKSKIYENNGDIESAFYYLKRYAEIKDSALISLETDKISEIENINLLKEKDYKFSLLNKENELNKIKVDKANNEILIYIVFLGISLVLIIVIIIFLVIIFKQLKIKRLNIASIEKINRKISQQNIEILNKKEELESVNEELEVSNQYSQKLKEEAEKNSQYKSMFLANMSHEIRTPMNGIIGLTDILQDCVIDDKAREYAKIINTSANNLLNVINDILDYSKIESNQIIIENIPIKLNEEIDEVIQILEAKAEEKGLELIVEYDTLIPEYIVSDPTRIKQIITNLANNAIKFTKKGYVKIKVNLFEQNNSDIVIEFRIIDTGIGIKEEHLDVIFNEFTQADKSTTRNYGGTGLGLSIAKHLTELLKGTIGISSKEGIGSEFWFTITASTFDGKIKNNRQDVNNQKLTFSVKNNYNILVVEDDEVNIELITTTLLRANHRIILAKNGLDALNIYKQKHSEIQLILMDLHMPIVDGYSAVSEIRKFELGSSIPQTFIIAVTANAMYGEREKCLNSGMNEYISKPFKPKELISFIDKINVFDL